MNERELGIFTEGVRTGLNLAGKYKETAVSEKITAMANEIVKKKSGARLGKKRGPHIQWKETEDDMIRSMTADGKTDREIGEELGYSGPSISARRMKIGIVKGKDFYIKRVIAEKKDSYEGLANLGQKLEG